MPDLAIIDYGGLRCRGASFTLSRGVTPSICTLYVIPQGDIDIQPGTLTLGYGSQQIQLSNCAIASANVRQHWDQKWPVMAVQVMDRRWKWRYGSISGIYNDHLQGTAALKSAKDLMFLCLVEMGEMTADISGCPAGVFPYVNWNATNPSLALADLCEKCACEVVLNPLTDRVEIWQLGVGQTTPTGLGELAPKYRFAPRAYVPSSIEAQGGPSYYQYRLKLDYVDRGTNLVQSQNPDWAGSTNFAYEGFNFPSVTSLLGSELALSTAWRQYRVVGQEGGGLNIPGLSIPITNTRQYVLQDFILYTAYDDQTQQYQKLPAYIEGDFWPYSDLPNNVSNQVFLGPFSLFKERNMVEFPFPVVKINSSGYLAPPVLYLQTAYQVKDVFGKYVRLTRSGSVGGGGGKLVLQRPECFAAYVSGSNTESVVGAELDNYVSLFKQKYSTPLASEITYGGFVRGTLDGNVAQSTWTIHPSRSVTTKVCEQEELDIYSPSRQERRRREQLRRLTEGM